MKYMKVLDPNILGTLAVTSLQSNTNMSSGGFGKQPVWVLAMDLYHHIPSKRFMEVHQEALEIVDLVFYIGCRVQVLEDAPTKVVPKEVRGLYGRIDGYKLENDDQTNPNVFTWKVRLFKYPERTALIVTSAM